MTSSYQRIDGINMKKNRWWLNKLGLILCITYIVLTLLCCYSAYGADNKGNFVLLQLPISLQLALLDLLGFLDQLYGLSWVSAYAWIMPPTLIFLMLIGGLFQNLSTYKPKV